MTVRLDRERWVGAGLKALAREGIDAVRVERLAGDLGVTKGSFYWHFTDRNALLAAMLDAWAARATGDVIAQIEEAGGSAPDRLLALIRIVVAGDGRLDRAVRGWAAHDTPAAVATEMVDQRRAAYLCGLFSELGFGEREARTRARLVYQAIIGQIMMGADAGRDERVADWVEVVFPMLVHREGEAPAQLRTRS